MPSPQEQAAEGPGAAGHGAAEPSAVSAGQEPPGRAAIPKVTADLKTAIAYLRAAAAKSRNADSKSALTNLAGQLRKSLADEASGQVPASVMQTLNRDATVADGACGTL